MKQEHATMPTPSHSPTSLILSSWTQRESALGSGPPEEQGQVLLEALGTLIIGGAYAMDREGEFVHRMVRGATSATFHQPGG